MGNYYSKVTPILKDDVSTNDPRSPTVNIDRSPIGNKVNVDEMSITKMRNLTSDLTELLESSQNTPMCLNTDRQQSLLDPRSPSTFTRTPLLWNETNASNITLQGSYIAQEEKSFTEVLPEDGDMSLSFKDCEESLNASHSVISEAKVFSDTSITSELKAEIDHIIQGLYDKGKDPRSPSVNILRTPLVFEAEVENKKTDEHKFEEQASLDPTINLCKQEKITPKIVIHQDENRSSTPQEKSVLITKSFVSRTPLSCVTNSKTQINSNMRKTALLGQIKQNITIYSSSADNTENRKSLTKSKIPTLTKK